MLGFTPLAAAPLADSGKVVYALTFTNITTTPVVDAASVFEDETIPAENIAAGVPVVDNANVIVVYNFGANDISATPVVDSVVAAVISNFAPQEITAGAPIFDDIAAAITSNFAPQEITLAAPTVGTATVAVTSNFAANDITASAPQIDALPFFQEYALTLVEVTAGVPTLPARFVWDYQEPISDSWTQQLDDASVWTVQAASSDIWSEKQDIVKFPYTVDADGNKYSNIALAILRASVGLEPEATLFETAQAQEGVALGAVYAQGSVLSWRDANAMEFYIFHNSTNQTQINYIRNVMLPYMAARQDDYINYYNASSDIGSSGWTDVSESGKVWTNAA